MEQVVLVTRHGNDALYRVSTEFTSKLPWRRIPMVGTSADGYLKAILRLPVKWVVNLDDDAFLTRAESLTSLMQHMEQNGYDYCGVADGSNGTIRYYFNAASMNPFFNIFWVESIRRKLNVNAEIGIGWKDEFKTMVPAFTPEKWQTEPVRWPCAQEPYYPFFFHLLRDCRPLFLKASTLHDNDDHITSIASDHEGNVFLYHTWYSRIYGRGRHFLGEDPHNQTRIDYVIRLARSLVATPVLSYQRLPPVS